MDDTSLFAELVHRLNLDDGLADAAPDRMGVLVRRWRGRDLDPPYMLHVDPPRPGGHLRSMACVSEPFPDTIPEIGALRLFLVHIEESVETAPKGHRHLLVGPAGVYAQPDAPPRIDRSVQRRTHVCRVVLSHRLARHVPALMETCSRILGPRCSVFSS